MSAHRKSVPSVVSRRAAWLAVLLSALPLHATAQSAPAPSTSASSAASPIGMDPMHMDAMHTDSMHTDSMHMDSMSRDSMDMESLDMSAMPAMDHGSAPDAPGTHKPGAQSTHPADPAPPHSPTHAETVPAADHQAMPGMAHHPQPTPPGHASHGPSHEAHSVPPPNRPTSAPPAGHAAKAGTAMGRMQGHAAPPGARSPDYSEGVGHDSMSNLGMAMEGGGPVGMLMLDRLEAVHGGANQGHAWDAQAWYGNDIDKLWLRTEGERRDGRLEGGDIEAFWSRSVAAHWDTQLGLRHELGAPGRDWVAFGIEGLAPWWFELRATGYVGPSGRTAARLRADYEMRFTQRLILQPEFEVNLYGRPDRERRIGRGLADAQLGLRLRYEIRREVAPYVGVVWTQRFGGTAAFAREDHEAVFDRQWVAGIRIWF